MIPVAFTFPQAQTLKNPVGVAGPRPSQGFGATPWYSGQGAKTEEPCFGTHSIDKSDDSRFTCSQR